MGYVYSDRNENGRRDVEEDGLQGVLVEVYLGGEVTAQGFTEEGGFYVFGFPQGGEYTVVETDKPGWDSTTSNEVTVLLEEGDVGTVNFGDQRSDEEDEISAESCTHQRYSYTGQQLLGRLSGGRMVCPIDIRGALSKCSFHHLSADGSQLYSGSLFKARSHVWGNTGHLHPAFHRLVHLKQPHACRGDPDVRICLSLCDAGE